MRGETGMTDTETRDPEASDGEPPLIAGYDALLLDLDGVVYLGRGAVPGAPESLSRAAERGVRLAYVTNNASRTPAAIADHLAALGVPATPEDVVTSAQAAARLVAERVPAGSPVLVVGGMGLRQALRARGLRPVSTAAENPVAVVQGMSPDLPTRCSPRACSRYGAAPGSSPPTATTRCRRSAASCRATGRWCGSSPPPPASSR